MKKLLICFSLIVVMLVCLTIPTFGAGTQTTVGAKDVVALPGSQVTMNITVSNNPGIVGCEFTLKWDERLTLKEASSGDAFSALTFTPPASTIGKTEANFIWDAMGIDSEDIKDGVILSLTFEVDKAVNDAILPITLSYTYGNIQDVNDNAVVVNFTNGSVTVISYTPGDVNSDGRINANDVRLIRQYISDGRKLNYEEGYNVYINELAADVTGDGVINTADITRIRRYISDGCIPNNPDGYCVELLPSPLCKHTSLIKVADYNAPTCTEAGNIAYWKCDNCGKYYQDNGAKYEIRIEDTVINATGHTYSTSWSSDENAHWHSAICGHSSEIKDYAEHTFVDHQCSVCGVSETNHQQFTVKFVDFDNSIIDIQTVNYGCDATKPSDPIRKNYAFMGWDTTFINVVSDLTIKAQYVRQYTVTFVDYDGTILKTEVVNRGDTATPPTDERLKREGYKFAFWNQLYNNVVSDLEILAVYEINRYTVTFLNADGSVISTISDVAHGTTVTPPKTADMYFDWNKTKGYRFTGWKNWNETQPIVDNVSITADYSEEITEPIIAIETKEICKGTPTADVSVYLCGSFQDVYGMSLKVQYAEQLVLTNTSVIVNSKLIGSESTLNSEKCLYELSWVDGKGIDIQERLKVLTLAFSIDSYTSAGEYIMELLEGTYIIDKNLSKISPIIVVGHIRIAE